MTDTLPPEASKAEGSFILEVLDGNLPTVVEPTDSVRKHHSECVKGE